LASTHSDSVEHVRNDNTYAGHASVDTVIERDSIFVEHKGDTVYVSKFKYIYKYRLLKDSLSNQSSDALLSQHSDTVSAQHSDTIQVPVEVEKKLTKWQSLKMNFGGIAIGGFFTALLAVVAYIVYRFIIKK
jgi:hypothetical protein